MKQTKTALGKLGEDISVKYLEKKGYKILERNYRYGRAEIDIICRFEDEIIFVEVKFRSEGMMEYPEQAVGKSKQKNIRIAADYYMIDNDLSIPARFDIIAVVKTDKFEIEHFEDAFYPFDTY